MCIFVYVHESALPVEARRSPGKRDGFEQPPLFWKLHSDFLQEPQVCFTGETSV